MTENGEKSATPRICDYEGSTYRTDFWEGREYEDLAERLALQKLMPPPGGRLIDLGAGFGRLADFYPGYDQVILLDYSRSMLREARERLGADLPCTCVAADLYNLPLNDALFDTALTVRVLHHVQNIPAALKEIRRVMRPGGAYVLEYANKRHLKAILRYLAGRQSWSPFSPEPVEFVNLNYDFHPAYVKARLSEAGFAIERQLTVSHFRLPLLKRLISPRHLAALDGLLQWSAPLFKLSPSVLVRARAKGGQAGARSGQGLFRCPHCHNPHLIQTPQALECPGCDRRWAVEDGLYNFKEPL